MDGPTLAKICNLECQKRGISKAQFYKDIGVSAPSFHGWANGAKPSEKYITAIEKCFGIDLKTYEKSDETDELREMLRDRQDLRILLHSAKMDSTPIIRSIQKEPRSDKLPGFFFAFAYFCGQKVQSETLDS